MNVSEEELSLAGFRFVDTGRAGDEWVNDYRYPTVKGDSLIVITLTVREDDRFLLAARAGYLRDYIPGKAIVASGVVAIEGDELAAAKLYDLKTLVTRLRDVLQSLFLVSLPEGFPRVAHTSPTEYERLLADDGEPDGS